MSDAAATLETPRPSSIVRPLDLQRHLARAGDHVDVVPFLDLLLIGLFFVLAGSRFIFAPGLAIDLPHSGSGPMSGLPPTAVLTVQESELILFEGQIVPINALAERLRRFVSGHVVADPVLLVQADRNVDIQEILTICELARRAGFVSVQLAAQEARPPGFAFPSGGGP